MTGWTVVLRGIRFRSGRSLVVFVLAAIATAATVIAPAYARTAQQSVLSDRLAAAPLSATSLAVRTDSLTAAAASPDSVAEAKLTVGNILASHPALSRHFDPPTGSADLETVAGTQDSPNAALVRLAFRDNVCAHLELKAGECRASGVLVSQRSAKEYGIAVGSRLELTARSNGSSSRSVPVVGVYLPRDAGEAYWGRGGYFAAGAPDGESSLPRADAAFVVDEDDLGLFGGTPSIQLDYRLRTDSVGLDDVPGLRSGLTGFTTELSAASLQLTTALRAVLDDIDTETDTLAVTIPVVAVPLALVCWFILFLLVVALTEERSAEVALAKLRGFSPGQASRFGRAEVRLLVLLAAPVGLALALAGVEVTARTTLWPGVHVQLRWPVFAAAAAAVLAALLAIRLASRRALSGGVLTLLRRVPERTGWRSGVGEAVVLAAASASLVAAVSDRTEPLALLAPALLAIVAGLALARLLSLWSRVRLSRDARRGRLAGVLAHAQLSRRNLGQRVTVVVAVGVALLSFAATAWDVAAGARADVAADTIGADRVLLVGAAHPQALMAAVSAAVGSAAVADRSVAMPVVRATERYGDSTVELLGAPAASFADVAVWRSHSEAEVTELTSRLRPVPTAPLNLRNFVDIRATATNIVGAPKLAAMVAPPGEPTRTIDLGALVGGAKQYRAPVPGCADGCRLLALAITRDGGGEGSTVAGALSVDAISTGTGSVAAGFDLPGRWRVNLARAPEARAQLQAGQALLLDFSTAGAQDLIIEHVDAPASMPVVLAGPSPADDTAAEEFVFPALADTPQRFFVVDREPTLPRAGRHALLFDLDYAVSSAQHSSALSDNSRLRYEVWASAAAPADLPSRLAQAGLQILADRSMAGEQQRLARSAPALGLRLYLAAAAAAVLLAAGTVLLTAYVGAQTRRYELAALRVAGVRASVLRRALLREYAYLLGLPLLVGLVVGTAGALLMLPGIPLVTAGVATGPLTYRPGGGVLPIATGFTMLALALATAVVLRLVRGATPDRLREGGTL